jgi:hypothetical protein
MSRTIHREINTAATIIATNPATKDTAMITDSETAITTTTSDSIG